MSEWSSEAKESLVRLVEMGKGWKYPEEEVRERLETQITELTDRFDDAKNVIAAQEARITALEARERRVREYCAVELTTAPGQETDAFLNGNECGRCDFATEILTILDEGAAE